MILELKSDNASRENPGLSSRGYFDSVAALMEGKHNGFWSHQLASLTEKRNRQMRDAVVSESD